MENIKGLNTQKLDELIKDKDLKGIRIITSALNGYTFLFFAIILFLYFKGDPAPKPGPADTELNDIMLIVALSITAIMIIASQIIPNNVFKKFKVTSKSTEGSIVNKSLGLITTHYIIKFALLEGAALFGLVTLILSVFNSAIRYNDIYWLAIIPMLVMNFIFILSFPTKERVIQLINDKILSQNF